VLERGSDLWMLDLQVLLPVPPATDKLTVVELVLNQVVGNGQQNRGFGAGIWCHPVIGMGGTVGQADIKDDQPRPVCFTLYDALGVGIEVVTRLKVSADEKNDLGVGMIWTGPVESHPVVIARATAR